MALHWSIFMPKKTSNLYVRIEPRVKKEAEAILSSLGISSSSAISMFYKQIVLHNGLPFDVRLPSSKIVNADKLTEEQFDEELEKGFADVQAGKTKDVAEVFQEIENR